MYQFHDKKTKIEKVDYINLYKKASIHIPNYKKYLTLMMKEISV